MMFVFSSKRNKYKKRRQKARIKKFHCQFGVPAELTVIIIIGGWVSSLVLAINLHRFFLKEIVLLREEGKG